MVIDEELDKWSHILWFLIQKRTKAQNKHPSHPPIQETFKMKEYTPGEFIDIADKFQESPGKVSRHS